MVAQATTLAMLFAGFLLASFGSGVSGATYQAEDAQDATRAPNAAWPARRVPTGEDHANERRSQAAIPRRECARVGGQLVFKSASRS
jgi:hypothetical protein